MSWNARSFIASQIEINMVRFVLFWPFVESTKCFAVFIFRVRTNNSTRSSYKVRLYQFLRNIDCIFEIIIWYNRPAGRQALIKLSRQHIRWFFSACHISANWIHPLWWMYMIQCRDWPCKSAPIILQKVFHLHLFSHRWWEILTLSHRFSDARSSFLHKYIIRQQFPYVA